MSPNQTFLILDTNFLRSIKSNQGAQIWLDYCAKVGIPLSFNFLFPPTLLLEYAGTTPKRKLPKVAGLSERQGEDAAKWVVRCSAQCKAFYDNKQLSRLVNQTFKALRRKAGECGRSYASRKAFQCTLKRWKKNRKLFREIRLYTLIFNTMTSHPHRTQERVDVHMQLLIWVLDLWERGNPVSIAKITQLMAERVRSISEKDGRDTSGPGWPDHTKIPNIKPTDLGDAEWISYVALGFPINRGTLVPIEVFTADDRDQAIARIKTCKNMVTGLFELIAENGFKDRLNMMSAPGKVHFSGRAGFESVDVSSL